MNSIYNITIARLSFLELNDKKKKYEKMVNSIIVNMLLIKSLLNSDKSIKWAVKSNAPTMNR